MHIEKSYFHMQYYLHSFYCIFDQINAALVRVTDLKHVNSGLLSLFHWLCPNLHAIHAK